MQKYDAFVSYSSADWRSCLALCERLKQDGVRLWLDRWNIAPGENIVSRIDDGLENSQALLLLASPNAFQSDWSEIERTSQMFRDPGGQKCRLIPILIENCKFPIMLANLKYIDYRDRSEDAYYEILCACSPPARVVTHGGLTTIIFREHPTVDWTDSAMIWQGLQPAQRRAIVVDLSRCRYLESADLAFIFRLHKRVCEINGKMAVYAADQGLLELFRITKFDRSLTIFDSRAQAVEFVNSGS
jgi:anti-anti-sigma factor